jgi:hypothetical protein
MLELRVHGALVESSSIRAMGYDEKSEELWIEFHSSSDLYVYFTVPAEIYGPAGRSRIAELRGEYVNLMIKPDYELSTGNAGRGVGPAYATARVVSVGFQFQEEDRQYAGRGGRRCG